MVKRPSLRRLLACVRVAVGNLCLLTLLLATGPMLGTESTEVTNVPTESKEACSESIVGIEHRLVRIRLHWTTTDFLPVGHGYLSSKPPIPSSHVGHKLSHELLAPLRC